MRAWTNANLLPDVPRVALSKPRSFENAVFNGGFLGHEVTGISSLTQNDKLTDVRQSSGFIARMQQACNLHIRLG